MAEPEKVQFEWMSWDGTDERAEAILKWANDVNVATHGIECGVSYKKVSPLGDFLNIWLPDGEYDPVNLGDCLILIDGHFHGVYESDFNKVIRGDY